MSQETLHMIGNAHIDPVWLWNWQEGFQEIKATFRSALDRLAEADDFFFVASSAAFYEFIEQNDPAMFLEIKSRVREGRWELVGGWWVEPDCNIPCGESFVRQGLYGQRYFLERFGRTASVGFCPDSFGHTASLPQILRLSRLETYCFLRPKPEEKELPGSLFWWEWQGNRVLTFRICNEYCTQPGADLTPHIEKCRYMCFYGVGNHGGGPTKKDIEWIREQPDLRFSTPERFFEEVDRVGLPVVRDELQHHARGCYSAHSGVKLWNRKAENLLLCAERLSSLAFKVCGLPYPDYRQAWKGVLFNQFHDILAGTSLESCYDDARDLYGEAMAIGARGLNHAFQALAWRIDIPPEEGMLPIVVFNPHEFPVKAPVELEWRGLKPEDELVGPDGEPIPFQAVRSEATVAKGRSRLAFVADLPALGYRVYRVRPGRPQSFAHVPARTIPDWNAVVYEDRTDTWSHGLERYDRRIGEFREVSRTIVEDGPARRVERRLSRYGDSTMQQDLTFHRDLDWVEVRVTLDWRERWKLLKLEFPAQSETSFWQVPFGQLLRENDGVEVPGQAWVQSGNLALINNGKHGFSATGDRLCMTVLRSPVYAHHDPYVPEEGRHYRFIDQGEQRFTFALLENAGTEEVCRIAALVNQPALSLRETYHAGTLPLEQSFGEAENVRLSALKKAEDGDELVVRVWNPKGHQVRGRITVLGQTLENDFGPYEIKTFQGPVLTDMLEL